MKPGDKLICKSSFVGWNGESILYTKGESYEILGIGTSTNKSCTIYHNHHPGCSMFKLEPELLTNYLYDYFYSPEELRLLKLESL